MAGTDQDELFVGVDVGGTNIATALVSVSGRIVARRRARTPRKGTGEDCLATVGDAIEGLLAEAEVDPESVGAIGLAIAGVVDPAEGRIVVTPNMNLTGLRPVDLLKDRLSAPIALGNDVDVGTLGEVFLGVARGARNVVGMFIGTGIGGGVVCDGRLVRGARDAAGEVGHMVMEVGGPLCGCGNRGCLEAIASRTAIEREVRAAVDAGRKTRLKKLLKGDFSRIRSGALRKALRKGDELTMEIVQRASEVIGHACLTVRHLLDPEVIVLGDAIYGICPEAVATRPGWEGMTAVANGDVRAVDDVPITRPGPRLAQGLGSLTRAIHPELELADFPADPPICE